MNSGIYLIKNMVNGKGYIGSTVNLKDRKYTHFSTLRNNKHHSPHLQNSFNKYGEQNFTYNIIEYCPKDRLLEREDVNINYYKSMDRNYGYNINKAERHAMSEEQKINMSKSLKEWFRLNPKPPSSNATKQKISDSLSGINSPFYGVPKTSAHKQKLSVALSGDKNPNYGKPMPAARKKKLSVLMTGRKNPMSGKHHSPKTKQKISKSVSIAMTGKIPSIETKLKTSKSIKEWWRKRKIEQKIAS
jgi:group I intron endonuclease